MQEKGSRGGKGSGFWLREGEGVEGEGFQGDAVYRLNVSRPSALALTVK